MTRGLGSPSTWAYDGVKEVFARALSHLLMPARKPASPARRLTPIAEELDRRACLRRDRHQQRAITEGREDPPLCADIVAKVESCRARNFSQKHTDGNGVLLQAGR